MQRKVLEGLKYMSRKVLEGLKYRLGSCNDAHSTATPRHIVFSLGLIILRFNQLLTFCLTLF